MLAAFRGESLLVPALPTGCVGLAGGGKQHNAKFCRERHAHGKKRTGNPVACGIVESVRAVAVSVVGRADWLGKRFCFVNNAPVLYGKKTAVLLDCRFLSRTSVTASRRESPCRTPCCRDGRPGALSGKSHRP